MNLIKPFEKPLIIKIFKSINTMTLYDIEFFQDNIEDFIQTFIDEEGYRLCVTDRLIYSTRKKLNNKSVELLQCSECSGRF